MRLEDQAVSGQQARKGAPDTRTVQPAAGTPISRSFLRSSIDASVPLFRSREAEGREKGGKGRTTAGFGTKVLFVARTVQS